MKISKAKTICRQLQIQLQRNRFAICHNIIDSVEQEESSDGTITTLAEIEGLDQVIISILDKAGYIYLTDILAVTDEELMAIPAIREKRLDALKAQIRLTLLENERIQNGK